MQYFFARHCFNCFGAPRLLIYFSGSLGHCLERYCRFMDVFLSENQEYVGSDVLQSMIDSFCIVPDEFDSNFFVIPYGVTGYYESNIDCYELYVKKRAV